MKNIFILIYVMTDLKENSSWQTDVLRPILKVWDKVQVVEIEYLEKRCRWTLKIRTAYKIEWQMYYEVYDENADYYREVCWEEDSYCEDTWMQSGLIIWTVYWYYSEK